MIRTGRIRRPRAGPDGTALLRELITQNQAEISRADGKASVLLAATGALLGLLLAQHPGTHAGTAALWWLGTTTAAGAFLASLLAVVPRLGRARRGRATLITYFADVVRADRQDRLLTALRASSGAQAPRLLHALRATSRIAHAKNRWIARAVMLLVPAVAAFLAGLAQARWSA